MSMPVTSRATSGANPLEHIPGEDGWPIVGNTFAALTDPVGHVEAMHRKHGPVFRRPPVRIPQRRAAGARGQRAGVYSTAIRISPRPAAGASCSTSLFPRGLMLMDFDEHRLHRKALGVAFKPAPMKAYLGALNDGIARRIAEWHLAGSGQGGATELQFYPPSSS